MRTHHLLVGMTLVGFTQISFGAVPAIDANSVLGMVQNSMLPAVDRLTAQAISWLGIFAVLQFVIANFKSLTNDGDLQSGLKNLILAVAWVSIVLYLINNGPQFIRAVGDQMMGVVGFDLPSPGSVMRTTFAATATLTALAMGASAAPLFGNTLGMLIVYLAIFVLAVGVLFAFKIFMLQLELGLIAMMAPLSFSFLGLSALRDQGIAPFKALISLAYRMILLTVILSAFGKVSEIIVDTLSNTGSFEFIENPGAVVDKLLSAMGAYLLLAYLTFKSDSIAASLASGSTSMGTGDVAQAAATGAALGAAVATGGASVAATASSTPKSMADFMDRMAASASSISNASPMGSGGDMPLSPPPTRIASLSAGSGSSSSSMPARMPSPSAGWRSVYSGSVGPDLSGAAESSGMASSTPSATAGADGSAPTAPAANASTTTPASAGEGSTSKASSVVGSGRRAPSLTPAAAAAASAGSDRTIPGPVRSSPATSSASSRPPVRPSGVPKRDAYSASLGQDAASTPGSGLGAGISGAPAADGSRPADTASHQQGPRKPTLGERLSEANRNVSQEQAATHVSINIHHAE